MKKFLRKDKLIYNILSPVNKGGNSTNILYRVAVIRQLGT